MKFASEWGENIVEKEENASYKNFLLLLKGISSGFYNVCSYPIPTQ